MFFIILNMVAACSNEDETIIKVEDFTRRQAFTFTALKDSSRADSNVFATMLFIKGEVQGEVIVAADGAGGCRFSGKIDTSFRGDWYVRHATMGVTPIGDVKGNLTITFRFLKM